MLSPGFESWLCHLRVVWAWPSCIHKTGLPYWWLRLTRYNYTEAPQSTWPRVSPQPAVNHPVGSQAAELQGWRAERTSKMVKGSDQTWGITRMGLRQDQGWEGTQHDQG